MAENRQGMKRRWSRFSLWLVVIVIVIVSTLALYYTGSNKSGGTTPSSTVPAGTLQLTALYPHTFDDMGISISYPSDWEKLQGNSSDSITLDSKSLCMGIPLMMGIFTPVDISSMDLQYAIDYMVSLFIEKTGFTVVSNGSITVNGIYMVKVVTSDITSYSYESWKVFIFIYNDNMLGTMVAYSPADCWEYFEPAVYTIASTYQILE